MCRLQVSSVTADELRTVSRRAEAERRCERTQVSLRSFSHVRGQTMGLCRPFCVWRQRVPMVCLVQYVKWKVALIYYGA
jgi:hypothetical protein